MTQRWIALARTGADPLVAVVLATAALLLRRHLPTDGLFYDDAWQALGAARGSLSELAIVGQTQPAFATELMAWGRIFGTSDVSMVTPTLIAGFLGPPLVYLFLRRLGYARSVSGLLGTALAVAPVHVIYSTRVKSYTTDVLIILGITLVVGRLARWRWRPSTAAGWVAGSAVVGSFSSFTLLAAVAAGIVLVLHPHDDRKVRGMAVAVQILLHAAFLAAVSRRYNAQLVADFFEGKDGFVALDANPVELGRSLVTHLLRIVSVFPGVPGPEGWLLACLVTAVAGLVATAWRGPHAIPSRFLVLAALIALGGSLAGTVPFGPRSIPPISGGGRVTLWLVPAIALGLAASLEWLRRALAGRSGLRRTFDALALVLAGLLLVTAIGTGKDYPLAGGREGTQYVMARLDERDAVWITRPTTFSFALYADTPLRIQATPERSIGFLPDFVDPRFTVIADFYPDAEDLQASVEEADRVWVVHANADPGGPLYKPYRIGLAIELTAAGFEPERTVDVGLTIVDLWQR